MSEDIAQAIVDLALEDPFLGQERAINELSQGRVFFSPAVGCAKFYISKHPIDYADLLNGRFIPFFDGHGVTLPSVNFFSSTRRVYQGEHREGRAPM